MLQLADEVLGPKIKVIGVGGGGGNAVNTMIEAGIQGVDFIAANTDCQVLETNQAPLKVQLGKNLTKGLGAGANPEIGCAAALEDASRLAEVLNGADMVFVTAGMGGGTGTGAAPVIAQVARDMGALTVGVVTKPFMFEGLQRKKKAHSGIAELAKAVDALIVIPNDRLVALAGNGATLRDSFGMVDNVCLNAVRGISDLVLVPGLINVDFADVRTIMTGMGRALMGTGFGKGEKRSVDAAQMSINSPLLEDVSINGATGILVNITGSPDLTLAEVNEACSLIQDAADPDANIIFGSVIDANMGDEVRITVIATGFQSRQSETVGASGSTGSRPTTRRQDQMTLPMQSPSHPAYAATLASARLPVVEAVDLDDFEMGAYASISAYPGGTMASPMPLSPAGAVAASHASAMGAYPSPSADWPASDSRPVIRPPVSSAIASAGQAGGRRPSGHMPAMAAEELGIEESEFDKPTYLRRGLMDPASR